MRISATSVIRVAGKIAGVAEEIAEAVEAGLPPVDRPAAISVPVRAGGRKWKLQWEGRVRLTPLDN